MNEISIALIRHGDYEQRSNTPSAHQPWSLNADGRQQATECAKQLNQISERLELPISAQWFSSPLARAQETARIVRENLMKDASIELCEDLMERGLGAANNLTIDEIETCLKALNLFEQTPSDWKSNSHFQLPLPGAESLMSAGVRVSKRLSSIAQESKNQGTLVPVIGHGAAFRHAAHLLGILNFEDIKKFSMYFARPVVISQNRKGEWTHSAGEWKVRQPQADFTD